MMFGTQQVGGFEAARVICDTMPGEADSITSLAFDPFEELLWAGLGSGKIVSHLSPELERYTCFSAHTSQIRKMLPDASGLLTLSEDTLRYFTKGGLLQLSYSTEEMVNMTCAMFADRYAGMADSSKVLLSGSDSLFFFDLDQGRILRQISVNDAGVNALDRGTRVICCGGSNGELTIHDPSSLRIIQSLQAHSGGINDIAIKNDLLVTCGWSQRAGQMFVDGMLRVYDLRTYRQLQPIAFPAGACFLKFMPKLSSTLLIASQSGQFQLLDIQHGLAGGMMFSQLDSIGPQNPLLCLDVSSTGECIAFGDASAMLHLWSDRDDYRVNDFSQPTDIVPLVPPQPPVKLDFNTPLSYMPLPLEGDGEMLSTWPDMDCMVPRYRPIDNSIMQQLRVKDFVGYATNVTNIKRNTALLSPISYNRSQSNNSGSSSGSNLSNVLEAPVVDTEVEKAFTLQEPSTPTKKVRPPKKYRVVQINSSRLDNDAAHVATFYNKTRFGSLEHTLPESYCNPLLQVLNAQPFLRRYCISHLCDQEFCATCELGFLFHMLDVAQGRNCHSSNFLRTISYLPRVREYGLVDDDERSDAIGSLRSSGTTVHHSFDTVIDLSSSTSCSFPLHSSSARRFSATSFTPLLEHFTRYILQRLHDESIHNVQPAYRTQPMPDEHVRAVEQQFGYNFHITSVCLSCQTEIAKVPTKGFTVTLGYPNLKESGFTSPSFATSLRRSMSGEYEFIDEDGLCPTCGTYQPIRRTKELTSLPNTLCILADVNEERMQVWRPKQEDDTPEAILNSWLPLKLRISLDTQASPTVLSIQELAGGHSQTPGSYELTSLICNIHDPKTPEPEKPHYIAYIRRNKLVEGGMAEDPSRQKWYLFNDVAVSSVPEREVVAFDGDWKVPAVLVYTLTTSSPATTPLPTLSDINPITKDVFTIENPFQQHRYHPKLLAERTLPNPGSLVALDAEFVWVGPPQPQALLTSEMLAQQALAGNKKEQKQGRFSLARVSVISDKDGSDQEYDTILDEYIASRERITDYLTRFSGIKPGDLDPNVSPHIVTTLKHAYLKLRYLVDIGCIFVGHGLAKDFRMINIMMPRNQIIDTVTLFRMQNRRMIKLRFLASFLLSSDIQSETHCSLEDAFTALRLYRRYQQLTQEGTFDDTLKQIYKLGKEQNWDTQPSATDLSSAEASSPNIEPEEQGDA